MNTVTSMLKISNFDSLYLKEIKKFSLTSLLLHLESAFQHLLVEHECSLSLSFESDFKGEMFHDEALIKQVLFNLIKVAVESSRKAKILITARVFYHNIIEVNIQDDEPKFPNLILQNLDRGLNIDLNSSKFIKPKQGLSLYLLEKLCKYVGPFPTF